MKRILFVDDEPKVLEALQNLLRRFRKEWEMEFAPGGKEALERMALGPFDVIVTDMRMPNMDGAELLRRVQEEHPLTVRIVLSGQTEHEAMRRLVQSAHQFLSKPCDAAVLQETIQRSCNLNSILVDEGLRKIVAQLGQLPTQPGTLVEMKRVLENPNSSLKNVAAVVERDPALCAKLLQLVNSAFFGLARRVASIETAVAYLGVDVLKGLTAMIAVTDPTVSLRHATGFSLENWHAHSFLTARIAREIAAGLPGAKDAFVTGMLHDIGSLILATRLPAKVAATTAEARRSGRTLFVVEVELLGVSHAEIGAYLLGLWGLPTPVVEAVAFHHTPSRVAQSAFDLLGAVHVADALAHELLAEGAEAPTLRQAALDQEYLATLGVTDRLPAWKQVASTLMQPTEVS